MIKISVNQKNGTFQMVAQGHAEYAETGKDIVCASVSILTHSLETMANEYDKEGKIRLEELFISDGFEEITYKDLSGCMLSCLTMFIEGIKSISEQYEKYVSIEFGDELL